jgi:hypothetical protein
MAISIDFKSAKIDVDDAGAMPNVATGIKRAVIHLTRGFRGPDADPVSDNNAFKITGDVDVLVDTIAEGDDVLNGSWQFGFIQILKVDSVSFTWSGRRDSEGEVFIPLSSEPAWPTANLVCLDGDPGTVLFYNSNPHTGLRRRAQPGQKILVHISNSMTDHPAMGTIYKVPNNVTKTQNFLSGMERELEGFAVFTARDGAGSLHPIAHVHWHLKTDARFKWRRNTPTGAMRTQILEFGPPLLSLPVDPSVRTLLSRPTPPLHNDLSKGALARAPRSALSKQDSAKRSLFLPQDFFK